MSTERRNETTKKFSIIPGTTKLKPMEFNHITIMSGHNCVKNADEVIASFESCAQPQKVLDVISQYELVKKPVHVMDGIYYSHVYSADHFEINLSMKLGEDLVPVTQACVAFEKGSADKVWTRALQMARKTGLATTPTCVKARPKAPFVCDILHPALSLWYLLNGWDWTGEFIGYAAAYTIRQRERAKTNR